MTVSPTARHHRQHHPGQPLLLSFMVVVVVVVMVVQRLRAGSSSWLAVIAIQAKAPEGQLPPPLLPQLPLPQQLPPPVRGALPLPGQRTESLSALQSPSSQFLLVVVTIFAPSKSPSALHLLPDFSGRLNGLRLAPPLASLAGWRLAGRCSRQGTTATMTAPGDWQDWHQVRIAVPSKPLTSSAALRCSLKTLRCSQQRVAVDPVPSDGPAPRYRRCSSPPQHPSSSSPPASPSCTSRTSCACSSTALLVPRLHHSASLASLVGLPGPVTRPRGPALLCICLYTQSIAQKAGPFSVARLKWTCLSIIFSR